MANKRGLKYPYEITSGIAYVYVKNKHGNFTVQFDEADFVKILRAGFGFGVTRHKRQGSNKYYYYATTTIYDDKEPKFTQLHRWIVEAQRGLQVDHLNHDTLDNRKCNLQIKTTHGNSVNRLGANRNSKSGIRNVSWITCQQKWAVQLQVNGKNKRFATFEFDELDKAAELAERLRKEIYGL